MKSKIRTRDIRISVARRASAICALTAFAVAGVACSGAHESATDSAETNGAVTSAISNGSPPWTRSDLSSSITDDGRQLKIHYDKRGSAEGTWNFESEAPANDDADLILGWDYSGLHSWYQAGARVRVYVIAPNGEYTEKFLFGTKDAMKPVSDYFAEKSVTDVNFRVPARSKYGIRIEGANQDSSRILQGDLVVTYQLQKISVTGSFGGETYPADSGNTCLSNFYAIAPPGKYISLVRSGWNRNGVVGVAWRFSDGSCGPADPWSTACHVGWHGDRGEVGLQFGENDRMGTWSIAYSWFGRTSVRQVVMTSHPVMSPERIASNSSGPDVGEGAVHLSAEDGKRLIGVYGVYNCDGFITSLGLITRDAPTL